MTAAVATPTPMRSPTAPGNAPPATGTVEPTGPTGRPVNPHRRPSRSPYLTPVPDCEPPFDDDVDGPGAVRPDFSAGPGRHPSSTAPNGPAGPRFSVPLAVLVPATAGAPAADSDAESHRPGPDPLRSRDARRRAQTAARQPSVATGTTTLLPPARVHRPTTITSRGVPGWSSEADIGVRKTATEDLPAAERAASVLARALVEVLSGRRPLAQLRVHCAPEIYAGLIERPVPRPQALPHLLTVRVCEPADGVAEVGVAFRRAERVRAIAFRMQGVDGRWRITALQVG